MVTTKEQAVRQPFARPNHRIAHRAINPVFDPAALSQWVLALVLAVFLPGLAWSAEVNATLDRDRLTVGETVTLVLQTDDPQQSLEVDLDALGNDFQVIDQRSETQMSIVNGRQSAVVRMLITLEPLHAGALTIPALSFRGGSRTQPLTVRVEPAPELAPGELPPVFIEVEVEPADGPHYVHAQISLKVRIFYQQNLTEAAINPPEPSQASVRLLDEVPYQADRNGQRYRVLERRYAVFPERSGTLTIPPLQLSGRLIERPADRLWQPTVRGRRVRIESEPVVLDIQPRPATYSGVHWLPARSISLTQELTDGDSVTVGEPVTRTVILDAVGLEEHMLEEPVWPPLDKARIYPDQPQGLSRDDGEWVLGHREYRYAVVPEEPGELVLPELRLTWWDTVNDRQQVTVLAEQRVNVLPSTLGMPQSAPPALGTDLVTADRTAGPDGALWPWQGLSAVLAVLWLATLGLLIRSRSGMNGAGPTAARAPDDTEKTVLAALNAACTANDARAAHAALARWQRRFGPRTSDGGLMALSRTVGTPELAAAIRSLDALAYGPASDRSDWQGKEFWRVFDAWRRARLKTADADALPEDPLDLYAAAR